jgi:hypothetical protein
LLLLVLSLPLRYLLLVLVLLVLILLLFAMGFWGVVPFACVYSYVCSAPVKNERKGRILDYYFIDKEMESK